MGNQHPPEEGNVSDPKSRSYIYLPAASSEYGSNTSRCSHSYSSTSSSSGFTKVYCNDGHNPNVQYQTRNGPSASVSHHLQPQYPQSYAPPAPHPQQRLPLTQHNLYVNHTQDVDPVIRQQREQQQYVSRIAAAQSLGIDMTNPVFASAVRERTQASRPMDGYRAEPDPRYLSVAPLQDNRRQDRRPPGL